MARIWIPVGRELDELTVTATSITVGGLQLPAVAGGGFRVPANERLGSGTHVVLIDGAEPERELGSLLRNLATKASR